MQLYNFLESLLSGRALRRPPPAHPAHPTHLAYIVGCRGLPHDTMCPTPHTGRLMVPTHPLEPSDGGGATAHSAFSRMCPYVELPYVPNYWWRVHQIKSGCSVY
jgi:hypothetical protein